MPFSIDANMMRGIIMEHYNSPNNKKVPENVNEYQTIRMDSSSCIDDITVYVKLENDKIIDCKFDGVACTICTSSTDIMCDLVTGKTVEEAKKIMAEYFNMIYEKPYDEELLDEAIVFQNTHKQAARIKCATLGWTGLQNIIDKDKGEDDGR